MSKTYYYFTDFEDGEFGAQNEHVGTWEYSTARYRDGDASFRVYLPALQTGYQKFSKLAVTGRSTSLSVDELYTKFDFLYSTKPSSTAQQICSFIDGLGDSKLSLLLTTDGRIRLANAFGLSADTSTLILNPETWYRIEAYCSTGSTGTVIVKVDGNIIYSWVADLGNNITYHKHNYFTLGRVIAHGVGDTTDFYYDN